jgi:DNA-binding LytR/AlgR family response regulator
MANAFQGAPSGRDEATFENPHAVDRCDRLVILSGGRLAIRRAAATELLASNAIVLARTAGNNTLLVTESSEYAVHASLVAVVERLQAFGLERIRRGTAVNLARVRRMVSRGQHRLSLYLDNGLTVEVGRTYQQAIRLRLGGRSRH